MEQLYVELTDGVSWDRYKKAAACPGPLIGYWLLVMSLEDARERRPLSISLFPASARAMRWRRIGPRLLALG